MSDRAFVVEAGVVVADGVDPRAVGAAVTVELCGHWEHEPPCTWPHNSAIDGERFRTVCVAGEHEVDDVAARIEAALRADDGWRVVAVARRPPADDERELAEALLRSPRRVAPQRPPAKEAGMAEEHETGVAGSEVTGDAEVRGGREQGSRDPGTTTDADTGAEAGRPSQPGGAEGPPFAEGEAPSDDELADPDVGGTAGGGPAGG
jgi:hypothetical protein